jgi:hypothetical protein
MITNDGQFSNTPGRQANQQLEPIDNSEKNSLKGGIYFDGQQSTINADGKPINNWSQRRHSKIPNLQPPHSAYKRKSGDQKGSRETPSNQLPEFHECTSQVGANQAITESGVTGCPIHHEIAGKLGHRLVNAAVLGQGSRPQPTGSGTVLQGEQQIICHKQPNKRENKFKSGANRGVRRAWILSEIRRRLHGAGFHRYLRYGTRTEGERAGQKCSASPSPASVFSGGGGRETNRPAVWPVQCVAGKVGLPSRTRKGQRAPAPWAVCAAVGVPWLAAGAAGVERAWWGVGGCWLVKSSRVCVWPTWARPRSAHRLPR